MLKDHFNIQNVDFDEVKDVDAVVLVNAHEAFRKITSEMLKNKMKKGKPVLVDAKNVYFGKMDGSWVYKNL